MYTYNYNVLDVSSTLLLLFARRKFVASLAGETCSAEHKMRTKRKILCGASNGNEWRNEQT